MNIKKFAAIILSVMVVFSLISCKDDSQTDDIQADAVTSITKEETLPDETEETEFATEIDSADAETTVAETQVDSSDPAGWSTAQIVDFYKNAAAKTMSGAKSNREITLKDVSINNGEYESAINFIMPIMSKLISNNSEEVDGITGGFENLTESDVASAKAYKSGNNTVVEMVMKKQVSGPREDANSGSVGHAITAVGDIGQVVTQLTDLGLPLELSDNDTKIYYTNPTVKVVVDGNGKIVSGTWKYTVEISMNNYKAFGKDVKSTSVIMDNKITLI